MQHLFGSEIPDLVRDFQAHIRTKYHVEVLVEENRNAQGKTVYDVFLSENTPHFLAIEQETEVFLTEWLERKNAQAWQTVSARSMVLMKCLSLTLRQIVAFLFYLIFNSKK